MQVAINVLVFVLGYLIAILVATRPLDTRKSILKFLNRLRFVADGFQTSPTSPSSIEKAEILDTDEKTSLLAAPSELLTKAQVESLYDPENTWQGLAYTDFTSTILARGSHARTFPCVYATMGYRSNDHRYVFLDSNDISAPHNVRKLAPALLEYLRISPSLGPNTSLVVMAAPPADETQAHKSVEEYNNSFWDLLRGLRICDPTAWPADIPQDTEDAKWTFCFNGQPVFPVMLTPAHQERWSRHMSVPIIALQPKWVLDQLLGTPEKREQAQGKVRSLLAKYDRIGISPDLTSYGEVGTSEVRQLCLMDRNERVECPYRNFDE